MGTTVLRSSGPASRRHAASPNSTRRVLFTERSFAFRVDRRRRAMDAMKMTHRAVQQPSLQMNTRRSLVIAATVSALAKWTAVCAQAPVQATEASLREAIRQYVVA